MVHIGLIIVLYDLLLQESLLTTLLASEVITRRCTSEYLKLVVALNVLRRRKY